MSIKYHKLKLLSGVLFCGVMSTESICGGLWSILVSNDVVCTEDYVKLDSMILNCGVIPTHYKYICILALTTFKTATWTAEICRWSLYNIITFIIPKGILLFFLINCIHLINARNMEDIILSFVHILNQTNPVHTIPSSFCNIHFNIADPSTPRPSTWTLFFRFSS